MPGLSLRAARRVTVGAAAVLTATSLFAAAATAAAASPTTTPTTNRVTTGNPRVSVIVTMNQTTDNDTTAALAATLRAAGGTIGTRLPIVHGFTATVPQSLLPTLAAQPGVRSVTPNASGHLASLDGDLGYDPDSDEGSLPWIEHMLGVTDTWAEGITGAGVDVALIDSGVAPVEGLTSGNMVNGPDLSFESQYADVRHVDTFGHGTHMASIIAGRDAAGSPASYEQSGRYAGIAPDARIISLKVAAADGAADVSQVIAAIDWVTEYGHSNGLNIRVLNLSYGTDSTQSYLLDPLAYAVEQAWAQGIVVVVAAGNDGTTRQQLADPAIDPYVIAVGADDPNGTASTTDDVVPAFAQRGTTARRVDVIAPGVHVLGLRDPNSYVDQNNPGGRVGSRFIRGSGTSQATAVASGVAALVLQKYPNATPDQVKYLLRSSAQALPAAPDLWEGLGVLNAADAVAGNPALAPVQSFPAAGGQGTLEGARGSSHVDLDGTTLTGEQDIFGQQWTGQPAWTGSGTFNGTGWTGDSWGSDGGWSAVDWSSADWTGTSWSGRSWVGRSWVDGSWDGRSWVDSAWTGRSWVGRSWVDGSWADATWS